MALLNFKKSKDQPAPIKDFNGLLSGFSMEIMPRTAEKVESFSNIITQGYFNLHRSYRWNFN